MSDTPSTTAPEQNILIVADPGRASRDAQAVTKKLEQDLSTAGSSPTRVYVQSQLLQVSADDTTPNRQAHVYREGYAEGTAIGSGGSADGKEADVVVLLTEMPRHDGRDLIAVETFADDRVALVSNPIFGAAGSLKRLRKTLAEVIGSLLEPTVGAATGDSTDHSRREHHDQGTTRGTAAGENGREHRDRGTTHSAATGNTGHEQRRSGPLATLNTMLGMVKQNEPWSTLPKMSGALAAAMGTGAFGVFYSSIWQMASFLSPLRMSIITAVSIAIMVAWLIVANKLWDRPRNNSARAIIALYNGSTLLTLILLVVCLYVVLFCAILIGGIAVIDPEFLAQQLGAPAEFTHYLRIAWLSTSMGVVAGALGAGFDSDADLRRITNGARDRQREYAAQEDSEQDGADRRGRTTS